jgi:hypothetical protein
MGAVSLTHFRHPEIRGGSIDQAFSVMPVLLSCDKKSLGGRVRASSVIAAPPAADPLRNSLRLILRINSFIEKGASPN